MGACEKPFELGWWGKNHLFGDDLGLAKQALATARIDKEWAKNGYVTTTLYPNDLFFILFRKNKPPKKYFNAINASVFSVVDGEFTTIYQRELPLPKQEKQ
jgi:hypothetical protein